MRHFSGPWEPPSAWCHQNGYRGGMPEDENEVKCIVEIGVHFGYSLFTFARDYPKATVIGIDNFCYHDSDEARVHLERHVPDFKNIRILEGDSLKVAAGWRNPEVYLDIDMLHIDGGHDYQTCKDDFEAWSPFVMPGGVVLFHDVISHENDVGRFLEEIGGELLDNTHPGLGIWRKEDA